MSIAPDQSRSEDSGSEPAGTDSPSLSASVRKGAIWVVATNLLLRIANVLLTAIVAHILSPHDFGVFAVALTAYAIVSSIGELGVSACLMRADLDIDSLAPTVATVSVVSCATLAGAMAIFAGPVAAALGSAAAVGPIRVMSLAVLLTGAFAVPNSQMMRDFKQDKIFLANVVGFIPSTVVLVGLAESGGGAMAFAWSLVARQFITGCVLIATAPRYYWPGMARSALSVIVKFGLPLAGANFVSYILLNVDYAFVGHLLGASQLGIYVLAFTVASWPYGVLGAVINNLSTPAFSRLKHDPVLLRNGMATALRGVSLIVLPMCGMTAALARPIVLTVYGAKWAASANSLFILSLYGAVSMICLLFANMLTSLGRTKILLLLQLIWIGSLVPAMALGVHRDGIVGAAYAHVAVIVPIVLPSYLLALRHATGVRFATLGKAVLPALLASAAAALTARGVAAHLSSPLLQLIAGLAAGGTIYAICAGQELIAVLGRGRAAERVLRACGSVARRLGLARTGRAESPAGYSPVEAAEVAEDFGLSILNGREAQPDVHRPEEVLATARHGEASLSQVVELLEHDLAYQERSLGPDHPHTLASRSNLAYAYARMGSMEKAVLHYERSFVDWQRLLGPDHPRTLRTSNYLASAYRQVGRLAEAIPLYESTLVERKRMLGPDHPSTLRSSNYLASVYSESGRLAEAVPLYEETLAGWQRLLGPVDPVSLRACSNLVSVYREAGRLADAASLCERTIAHCTRVLGDDHALTRAVRRDLSMTQDRARTGNGHPDASRSAKGKSSQRDAEAAESR